mmetsp:Transcript_33482/g.96091  ORF Transcript_33482/g.96091 Transcript_33482/m.96091 type:complete len:356 (+) Transcript_33482:377-1444(+)
MGWNDTAGTFFTSSRFQCSVRRGSGVVNKYAALVESRPGDLVRDAQIPEHTGGTGTCLRKRRRCVLGSAWAIQADLRQNALRLQHRLSRGHEEGALPCVLIGGAREEGGLADVVCLQRRGGRVQPPRGGHATEILRCNHGHAGSSRRRASERTEVSGLRRGSDHRCAEQPEDPARDQDTGRAQHALRVLRRLSRVHGPVHGPLTVSGAGGPREKGGPHRGCAGLWPVEARRAVCRAAGHGDAPLQARGDSAGPARLRRAAHLPQARAEAREVEGARGWRRLEGREAKGARGRRRPEGLQAVVERAYADLLEGGSPNGEPQSIVAEGLLGVLPVLGEDRPVRKVPPGEARTVWRPR